MQKGGTPGMPGCLAHTGIISQWIREARDNNEDLVVLWLDLGNAYGSIKHKLEETALNRYYVPSKSTDFILDYYKTFSLRVTSGSVTLNWHHLEKVIITGCTISVILFALTMNMVAKAVQV